MELREACGFAYKVVRSDGEVIGQGVYRDENAVGMFLNSIMQEAVAIRGNLATPKPLVMGAEDWEKHKNSTKCHICNKSLIKDLFLFLVYDHDKGDYWGQSHKNVLTKH